MGGAGYSARRRSRPRNATCEPFSHIVAPAAAAEAAEMAANVARSMSEQTVTVNAAQRAAEVAAQLAARITAETKKTKADREEERKREREAKERGQTALPDPALQAQWPVQAGRAPDPGMPPPEPAPGPYLGPPEGQWPVAQRPMPPPRGPPPGPAPWGDHPHGPQGPGFGEGPWDGGREPQGWGGYGGHGPEGPGPHAVSGDCAMQGEMSGIHLSVDCTTLYADCARLRAAPGPSDPGAPTPQLDGGVHGGRHPERRAEGVGDASALRGHAHGVRARGGGGQEKGPGAWLAGGRGQAAGSQPAADAAGAAGPTPTPDVWQRPVPPRPARAWGLGGLRPGSPGALAASRAALLMRRCAFD